MSVAEIGPSDPEFERTPPHDISAEQGVLGGMLLSQDAIAEVVEVLRTPDFYRPAHQIVYDTILDLYGRGDPADAVTVAGELTKNGEIGRIGGAPYLHTLISQVPTAANAGFYARIVHERAILRRLVETGTRIVQMGYAADGADADEVLDRAQAEVFAIAEKRAGEDYVALSEIMPGALDEIEAIGSRGGQMVGCPTGFADLDALTNGLHPGQMVVIAARPAMGKALELDTPLPTPTGWTTMGEVTVGDHLIGADGKPTRVVAATEVMHGHLCYEIEFSDGEVIVADAQHQWRTTRVPAGRPAGVRRPHRRGEQVVAGSGSRTGETFPMAPPQALRPVSPQGSANRADFDACAVDGEILRLDAGGPWRLTTRAAQRLGDGVVVADEAHRSAAAGASSLGAASRARRPDAHGAPDRATKHEGRSRPTFRCTDWEPHRRLNRGGHRPATETVRPSEIRTTEELFAALAGRGRPVHAVECAAPFDLPPADLPVDPYALGAWLAGADGDRMRPTCCDNAGAEVEAAGRRTSEQAVEPPELRERLVRPDLLDATHIPAVYLRASEAQRRALLAGMLDTDGHISEIGQVQLGFVDKRLADDAHELILSLGYRATMTTKPVHGRSEETSTFYRINFTPAETVFRLPRKAARQRKNVHPKRRVRHIVDVRPVASVPVRCVQVDNADHMYLAGRSCIPTHNSTLALDLARAASIKHGLTSAFFSLEMGRNEITMRLLSAESRVALHAMRSGTMQDEDWTRLARRMSEVAEAPLFIDDSPNMSMMEIRAKCRRLKQQHDLRLVIVDYLQLMTSGKRVESRQVEVSEFSRSLKLLAKELGVPVIALSQLNRGPEQRTDKKPMVSDLRESGSIEQDADMVILLHREDAYEKESPRAGEADLIVAKHRNGPTATVTVAFQGHYSRFVDMAQ